MPTILVADDDPQIRKLVRTILEKEGYGVLEAKDGKEALALNVLHHPDLVVMDIYMPEKDGLETIVQLIKHQSTTKVLAISGNVYKGYDVSDVAKSLGAKELLLKPFSAKELLDQVETLLKIG